MLALSQPSFQPPVRWTFVSVTDAAEAPATKTARARATIAAAGRARCARRALLIGVIVRAVRCSRNAAVEPHMEEWPSTDDPEGIALLRSALVDAGYTPSAVREALATEVASGRDSAELPLYLQMLQNGGQLAALIKLFLLDLEVTAEEAEEALPGLVDRMAAMRVLERRGDTVKALVEIVPTEDLLIACDAFQQELARSDHVLGVSPPARVLAWLTVRSPVGRALDLGTGNGHQALFATRHADQVTAVDINPRAVRFAEFNALLNETSLDLREGNLFEPVAGETFDLIVSNPPYVISPENDITYRDSGLPGDSFSRADRHGSFRPTSSPAGSRTS